jgi:hypothetical protein
MQKSIVLYLLFAICFACSTGFRLNSQRTGASQKHNIVVDLAHAHYKSTVGKAVAAIAAVSAVPSIAVAEDNVRNVFQPTIDTAAMSSSLIYTVVPIVIYFVFNVVIAPKLGLIKEDSKTDNNLPPENKTPF